MKAFKVDTLSSPEHTYKAMMAPIVVPTRAHSRSDFKRRTKTFENYRLTVYKHVEKVEAREDAGCRGAYDPVKKKNGQKNTKCWSVPQIYRAVGSDC